MCKRLFFLAFGLCSVFVNNSAFADLVAWWKFDEGSGIVAADSSGFGYDGKLNGMDDSDWVDGIMGKALEFDGVNDYVTVPSPDLVGTNTLTLTAWIKREGQQSIYAGIVWSRDTNTQAGTGICFGSGPGFRANHELAYCWDESFWEWHSGLIVPDGKWVFVALVVEPTKATLYMGQDGALSSATHEAWHDIITEFNGVSMIGYDNYRLKGASDIPHKPFKGMIDEVRIYNHELDGDEISAIYAYVEGFDKPGDAYIAKHPDKVLQEAHRALRRLRDWGADPPGRTEQADKIAAVLLVIAKAREAKNLSSEQVLEDYYELIASFPDSPEAIEALCRVVALEPEDGLEYANKFLERDATGAKATQFYQTLIRDYVTESDYVNAEKHLKLFVDKYVGSEGGLKLLDQLMRGIGQNSNGERWHGFIQRYTRENPNSQFSCAVFRQQALELCRAKNFVELWKQAQRTRAEFPGTKLATYAGVILADGEYGQGNYVRALQILSPELLRGGGSESEAVGDIESTLRFYEEHTLREQGLDLAEVYKALARYAHDLGQNIVAVHCYKQGAKAAGFDLEAFGTAASESVKYCNAPPEKEVWFWSALFAAEEGDLITAAAGYETFLECDNKSILAARAFYDVARARMTAGLYAEARKAVVKAKAISPCPFVLQLESDLRFLMLVN